MRKSGEYPHLWKSGPDPRRHDMYLKWNQQRNQAGYRNETWLLDFETFVEMWDEHWENRGRGRDQYCMMRLDLDQPWDEHNTVVILRALQLEHQKETIRARKRETNSKTV